MLEKGTNMDISERANNKWSLAFGDMDIVFLLHLTTCNKMGRKPLKFVLIFCIEKMVNLSKIQKNSKILNFKFFSNFPTSNSPPPT